MNRRQLAWFMALVMLTLIVVVSAPAFPLPESPTNGEIAEGDEIEGQPSGSTVETILKQQEELLRGQRFSYDPAGRRDPFRSLFETLSPKSGPRPRGVAGMVVTDVDLVGIVKEDASQGNMALVMGSDNKGYFLRVGDSVYDGTLIAIDPRLGTITFRQQVDDPRRIKPYQDVVKRLIPLEDEESSDE